MVFRDRPALRFSLKVFAWLEPPRRSDEEKPLMIDSKILHQIAGQLHDMASRETGDVRRNKYLLLATECESLAQTVKDEEKSRLRLV
jgi:hypothetical protein